MTLFDGAGDWLNSASGWPDRAARGIGCDVVLAGAAFWGVFVVAVADGVWRFAVTGGAGERWNTAWSCPVYR